MGHSDNSDSKVIISMVLYSEV